MMWWLFNFWQEASMLPNLTIDTGVGAYDHAAEAY